MTVRRLVAFGLSLFVSVALAVPASGQTKEAPLTEKELLTQLEPLELEVQPLEANGLQPRPCGGRLRGAADVCLGRTGEGQPQRPYHAVGSEHRAQVDPANAQLVDEHLALFEIQPRQRHACLVERDPRGLAGLADRQAAHRHLAGEDPGLRLTGLRLEVERNPAGLQVDGHTGR